MIATLSLFKKYHFNLPLSNPERCFIWVSIDFKMRSKGRRQKAEGRRQKTNHANKIQQSYYKSCFLNSFIKFLSTERELFGSSGVDVKWTSLL